MYKLCVVMSMNNVTNTLAKAEAEALCTPTFRAMAVHWSGTRFGGKTHTWPSLGNGDVDCMSTLAVQSLPASMISAHTAQLYDCSIWGLISLPFDDSSNFSSSNFSSCSAFFNRSKLIPLALKLARQLPRSASNCRIC